MKLDIGAGRFPRPGYIPVDPYVAGHVYAMMWELPYPDDSVEAIYSSHALEHIPTARIMPTLTEWLRVLQPGGELILRTPDLIWLCNNFLQNPLPNWHLETIYGIQTHPGEFHQTGFTEEILRGYLTKAGWEIVRFQNQWTHDQNTLEFVCRKPSIRSET